ncbi:anthrax toxin lethal factor-related metalloendopeptidase [Salinicoccus roseus]|uniref:anthrax toxin lethal factor-related metalloendopeptidase n=1 Tax=Salinicoccus roseus TaxID=45670 RepID=UPI003567838F
MKQKTLTGIVMALGLMLMFTGFASQQASAASPSLQNMVEVRDNDGSYDANEAQAMINRLARVDERILAHTNRAGVRIILMDQPLTELPEFEYLSGVTPRGWEGTGRTWDDVPGAGGYTTAARIGYSNPGNSHSTINLELHEYGHAVDSYAAGFTVSESQAFRDIMAQEKDNLFRDHQVPGYFNTPGEYFAETFAMYYLGGNAGARLAERAPQTYQFMETFHNRLVTVQGVTGNTVELSWDALEGAAYYEIYRDDQLIDTTQAANYQDRGLDTSTTYKYHVRAMDQNDRPLLNSYFRTAATTNVSDAPEVDASRLEQTVNEAEQVPAASRTPELQSALENATALLNDNQATQDQLDEARSALSTALKNNEEPEVAEESTEEATEEESTEPSSEATSEQSTEEATGEESTEPSTEESTEELTGEPSQEESAEPSSEATSEQSTEEVTGEGSTESSAATASEGAEEEATTESDAESSNEESEDTEEATEEETEDSEASTEETAEDETSEEAIDTAQESEQTESGGSNIGLIIGAVVLFLLGIIAAIVLFLRRN